MTAIVWFRRDLRLRDNPALAAAAIDHAHLVPAFCLDPRLVQGRNRSLPRSRFMLGCLFALSRDLAAVGSGLVVLSGPPEQAIPGLADRCGAEVVLAAADVSRFARERDRGVGDTLEAAGQRLDLLAGTFAVDDVGELRTAGGDPYSVFTPFYRRWLKAPRRDPGGAPASLPPLPDAIEPSPVPELADLCLGSIPDVSDAHPLAPDPWEPGERAARKLVSHFLSDCADRYEERHDALGESGTSRLSPYLHFGCISPRELEAQLTGGDGHQAFRRQLCWRDFYAHVLLFNPGNARVKHQERYRRIRWRRSERLFAAWRNGRTGYPLVDAAMRQLSATGWMHNRARMVVGSFLVKDLGIDWRWGERWFMRLLLDGDEANNNGNWQWIASVGVDPQPVSRRIYNPTLQQQRFDPDGHYVRTFVRELENVPNEYLCEPWKMPDELQRSCECVIGVDYPAPIVDHAAARREALERYAASANRALS